MDAVQTQPRVQTYLALPIILALAVPALSLLPESVSGPTAVRIFIVLFLLMAGIDAATLKVPNLVVFPSIVFSLLVTLTLGRGLFVQALVGGVALLGIMFVLALLGRGAMGMGDVKVGCFAGCCLGFTNGFMALLVGFAAGGAFALVVVALLRLRKRTDIVPLTPFISGGAIVYGLFTTFLLGRAF